MEARYFGMKPYVAIQVAIVVVACISFCLFFHIAYDVYYVFPKERPTFANTFVSANELSVEYQSSNYLGRNEFERNYVFRRVMNKLVERESH